jgi:hypothetical protein
MEIKIMEADYVYEKNMFGFTCGIAFLFIGVLRER